MEKVIVLFIVALAVFMLGRILWKQIKNCDCGCCENCKIKANKCESNCSFCVDCSSKDKN